MTRGGSEEKESRAPAALLRLTLLRDERGFRVLDERPVEMLPLGWTRAGAEAGPSTYTLEVQDADGRALAVQSLDAQLPRDMEALAPEETGDLQRVPAAPGAVVSVLVPLDASAERVLLLENRPALFAPSEGGAGGRRELLSVDVGAYARRGGRR